MEKRFQVDSVTAIDDMFNCLRSNWYKRKGWIRRGTSAPNSIEVIIPSRIYHRVYDDLKLNIQRFAADYCTQVDKIRVLDGPEEAIILRIKYED